MRRLIAYAFVLLVSLPPMDSKDAQTVVGGVYNEQATSNQWIPIPSWLSGTWQAKFQTFLDTYDYRLGKRTLEQPATIQVHRLRTIGAQQDNTGQIWHYAGTPYVRVTNTETFNESQTISKWTVLGSDANLLKLCTIGEVTRCSKRNTEVKDTFIERTVVTYSPLSEGVIKVDLTITDFDHNGQALRHSESVCVERRVKPFVVVNHDEHGDLREKFLRFQAARNAPFVREDRKRSSRPAEHEEAPSFSK